MIAAADAAAARTVTQIDILDLRFWKLFLFTPSFDLRFSTNSHPSVDPYSILDLERAYGSRTEGLARQGPRFNRTKRMLQLRFKIALSFLWRFSSICLRSWVPRWVQNGKKSFKTSTLKSHLDFNSLSTPLFKECCWNFDPADTKNAPTTSEGCSFLYVWSFCLRLNSELDSAASLDRFWIGLGLHIRSVFASKRWS